MGKSQRLALVLGTAVLLAGFYFTLDKLRVTVERHMTDRFTQAIDQLGNDKLEIRLGGIYALERMAATSEKDHWKIMEVLTAYVREHAPWKEDQKVGEEQLAPRLTADVQAILTVLGRRSRAYQNGEHQRLDLRETDLRRADLSGAHLEGAILSGVHLEGANLISVHLAQAILRRADLKNANLTEAHLDKAFLGQAHLEGAIFKQAHLEGAYLIGAHLEGADLLGADFTDAFGLTWDQIKLALRDNRTRFPQYLTAQGQAEIEVR
ncbi:MAG: pentapeptide repeat-containing protein [Nitrospirae bacterium]|nr:MAG: pentapeptide repeat-containing protein [Nitrospirota bacterium]